MHSIDLGQEVITQGRWPTNPYVMRAFDSIDFQGKKVLDIGACNGLWSFEAEWRGAAQVYSVDGARVIRMLEHVQQTTIEPLIRARVVEGARLYIDDYDLPARLGAWGYDHHRVGHSRGEYARDEDGDGFQEVHVNTMEGVWSLLRSWPRPHRGTSQEHLPLYLSFFQFVHNARVRG